MSNYNNLVVDLHARRYVSNISGLSKDLGAEANQSYLLSHLGKYFTRSSPVNVFQEPLARRGVTLSRLGRLR